MTAMHLDQKLDVNGWGIVVASMCGDVTGGEVSAHRPLGPFAADDPFSLQQAETGRLGDRGGPRSVTELAADVGDVPWSGVRVAFGIPAATARPSAYGIARSSRR